MSVIDLASQTVLRTIQRVGAKRFDLLFDGPQLIGAAQSIPAYAKLTADNLYRGGVH